MTRRRTTRPAALDGALALTAAVALLVLLGGVTAGPASAQQELASPPAAGPAGAFTAAGQPGAAASPFANSAIGPVPPVTVTLSPGPHTVGDRVEAVIAVTVPAGRLSGEARFPVWPADGSGAWGQAEVIAAGAVERSDEGGAVTYRQRLVLAAFAPGTVALPPLAVALPYADRTALARTPAGLALTIDSVLPAPDPSGDPGATGDALTPRPPAPPRPLPLGVPVLVDGGDPRRALPGRRLPGLPPPPHGERRREQRHPPVRHRPPHRADRRGHRGPPGALVDGRPHPAQPRPPPLPRPRAGLPGAGEQHQ